MEGRVGISDFSDSKKTSYDTVESHESQNGAINSNFVNGASDDFLELAQTALSTRVSYLYV